MKKLIIIAMIIAMALGVSACGISSNSQETTIETTIDKNTSESSSNKVSATSTLSDISDDTIKKNIDVKAEKTEDGLVCVFITNNNDIVVDEIEIQVNFYDENNTILNLDTDGHDMVIPNSTVVSRIEAPKEYDHFNTEISVETGVHKNYKNHSNDVELTSNIGDDCVIIQIKNNSDVTIEEIEYDVVLYKNDKIVTVKYPEDIYDLKPGEGKTEKVDTYGANFDRAEVYLNQAHTFS